MGEALTAIQELEKRGFKAKTVSVRHVPELHEDIDSLRRQGLLNERLADVYLQFKYDVASLVPDAATIFIVAAHQPITRACFLLRGRAYEADVPPTYIWEESDALVQAAVGAVLQPAGFHMAKARLPAKTLATRSGLARYGKNNVTYVPSFGSFHRLVVLAADCPCEEDSWGERRAMKACQECQKCVKVCPTGCIPTDRFLIHSENCLTWHNERAEPFADWIKPEWHNALVGCLRCQLVCPANNDQLDQVVDGPQFSEAETASLLRSPLSPDDLSQETRRKVASIALGDSYDVLPRNLAVLIRNQDSTAR